MSQPVKGDREQRNRIGEVLNGRYRLEAVIGSGVQGVVYRAVDSKCDEAVAVKILRDEVAADPDWRERMFREAQAMASLLGTAAVRVLDQGWTSDRAHFLVMELLRGHDLEQALLSIEARGERTEPKQLLDILSPLVGTLERAHAHGIVHRDIKPANVYLLDDGGVRLMDFGFAKFVRLRGLTLTGYVAGSPSYIAPEMWLHGSDKVDQRVDVYSLAAVAFRALGGRPPFMGNSMTEVYLAATTAPRPRLTALRSDLPPNVDAWVDQSLAVDPDTRFSTASAMVNALSSALGLLQSQRKGPRAFIRK
ncbi:MAG TPA: serine/threonine-protein kinase [Polyangiaceae bacterium]